MQVNNRTWSLNSKQKIYTTYILLCVFVRESHFLEHTEEGYSRGEAKDSQHAGDTRVSRLHDLQLDL